MVPEIELKSFGTFDKCTLVFSPSHPLTKVKHGEHHLQGNFYVLPHTFSTISFPFLPADALMAKKEILLLTSVFVCYSNLAKPWYVSLLQKELL